MCVGREGGRKGGRRKGKRGGEWGGGGRMEREGERTMEGVGNLHVVTEHQKPEVVKCTWEGGGRVGERWLASFPGRFSSWLGNEAKRDNVM